MIIESHDNKGKDVTAHTTMQGLGPITNTSQHYVKILLMTTIPTLEHQVQLTARIRIDVGVAYS